MFDTRDIRGNDINQDYAEIRRYWEPVVEITQIKGDSETHPVLSPDDPFADFETYPYYIQREWTNYVPQPGDYIRSALKTGLELESDIGVNPYQFGVIGSTDAHTSLASTRDENFWGKMASSEPDEERMHHYVIRSLTGDDALSTFSWEEVASGLAAVWARENTREAIFEAMQRKETYATTGTRITVRLFGGWDFEEDDVYRPEAVEIGYDKGVPMGSDLPTRPSGASAPVFIGSARW